MKLKDISDHFGLIQSSIERDVVEAMIRMYVKQKCREQRELCAKSFPSHEHPEILDKIFNTPEPEFD